MVVEEDKIFIGWIARQHIGTIMPLLEAAGRRGDVVTGLVIEIESFFWPREGGQCYRGIVQL